MKITKSQLKQIIKEEMATLLNENTQASDLDTLILTFGAQLKKKNQPLEKLRVLDMVQGILKAFGRDDLVKVLEGARTAATTADSNTAAQQSWKSEVPSVTQGPWRTP